MSEVLSGPQAEIDLDALRANGKVARQLARGSQVVAVIKANGYGHGLCEVARALAKVVDAFAVARLSEARVLRRAGMDARLLVLSGVASEQALREAAELQLDWVIYEMDGLRRLCGSRLPGKLNVWLKLDSGMGRLGLVEPEFDEALQALRACPWVGELILMSHLATADAAPGDERGRRLAAGQIARFGEWCSRAPDCARSIANSAALMRGRAEARLEWVRPGLMLYGACPGDDAEFSASLNLDGAALRPVMTLRAPLLAVRNVKRGQSVGYGAAWRAARATRVGTVGLGYRDGYPRHAFPKARALVAGVRVPLAGRVSMDMLAVDLGDCAHAAPGAPVTLWGDGLPVEEVAWAAGDIPYALLTAVGSQVPRTYRGAV